jgi:hypothetical protein
MQIIESFIAELRDEDNIRQLNINGNTNNTKQ